MKFNHRVKFNGFYYEKGQNVPLEFEKTENEPNTKLQEVVKTEDRNAQKLVTSDGYTKTEINRMPTVELKKLAKENGIDDSLSGADIKKALIAKFDL
jgi:hypothetical protein